MKELKFQHAYGQVVDEKLICKDHSLTKQEFKDESNINVLLERYQKTGLLPDMRQDGVYGDFADVPTYLEALTIVQQAQEAFEKLPASVRDRFGNSPEKFLEFTSDERNADEMVRLGLAEVRQDKQVEKPADNSSQHVTEKSQAGEQ